eukprot:6206209-Pleurochrysis_carterae.AAC.1
MVLRSTFAPPCIDQFYHDMYDFVTSHSAQVYLRDRAHETLHCLPTSNVCQHLEYVESLAVAPREFSIVVLQMEIEKRQLIDETSHQNSIANTAARRAPES